MGFLDVSARIDFGAGAVLRVNGARLFALVSAENESLIEHGDREQLERKTHERRHSIEIFEFA